MFNKRLLNEGIKVAFERGCIFHILYKKSKILITACISYRLVHNKLSQNLVALNDTHYIMDSVIQESGDGELGSLAL